MAVLWRVALKEGFTKIRLVSKEVGRILHLRMLKSGSAIDFGLFFCYTMLD